MICAVLYKASSHREKGAQGASVEIKGHYSLHLGHLYCIAPEHSSAHTSTRHCWEVSVLILRLRNRKYLLIKPIQIRNAKETHHGNVEFVDMLEKKNKNTQTWLVECFAASSTHPSAHNATEPLQCGTADAERGCSPFKAVSNRKMRGEERTLSVIVPRG